LCSHCFDFGPPGFFSILVSVIGALFSGGPGFSTIPSTPAYSGWEAAFTVVMWDQRGEGKTFERSGRSVAASMTIAQMTQDGIEVAEYLRRRLGKDKIVLLGWSWGTILGVNMVEERPDLFSVYVGTGQVVAMQEGEAIAYANVLAKSPGVTTPCAKRQAISCGRFAAVAASIVAAASEKADPTITTRSPKRSASRPTKGAASATATVGAVTVRLTARLLACKVRASIGNSGCVE